MDFVETGGGFWDSVGTEVEGEPYYEYTIVEPGGDGNEDNETYRVMARYQEPDNRTGFAPIHERGEVATMEDAKAWCEKHWEENQ